MIRKQKVKKVYLLVIYSRHSRTGYTRGQNSLTVRPYPQWLYFPAPEPKCGDAAVGKILKLTLDVKEFLHSFKGCKLVVGLLTESCRRLPRLMAMNYIHQLFLNYRWYDSQKSFQWKKTRWFFPCINRFHSFYKTAFEK